MDRARSDLVEGHCMQSGLLGFLELAVLAAFELPIYPVCDFLVLRHVGRRMRARCLILGGLRGHLAFNFARWAHERRQPWMSEQHVVRWPVLGVLIQAGTDERMCFIRVTGIWQSRRVAMDNCLLHGLEYVRQS
jgi:hypothetical protein